MSSSDEMAFLDRGAGRAMAAFVMARAAEVRACAEAYETDSGVCDDRVGIHLGRQAAFALAAAAEQAAVQYENSVRCLGEALSVPDRRIVQAVAAIWCDYQDYREEWAPSRTAARS